MQASAHRPFLLSPGWIIMILLLINLAVAWFIPILGDEAYYAYWAETPGWGYFDHPPMVAWWIALTHIFPQHPFTTRLIFLLAYGGIIFMVGRYNRITPGYLLLSMPLCMAIGPFATPDVPLLFLNFLFFACMEKEMRFSRGIRYFTLGLLLGLMMLTKWNAWWIPGFYLLFTTPKKEWTLFMLAVITSLLLSLPYWIWLTKHLAFSWGYHWESRHNGFHIQQPLLYMLFIPLCLGLPVRELFRKPHDRKAKVLWGGILIYLGCFFGLSFKGNIEPNWLVPCIIPLFFLVKNTTFPRPGFSLYRFGLPLLLLGLVVKGLLVFTPFSKDIPKIKEGFGKQQEMETLASITDTLPVVFVNSYMKASWFRYYTGKAAYSFNNLNYRMNQFDLDPSLEALNKQSVIMVPNWSYNPSDSACAFFSNHTEQVYISGGHYINYYLEPALYLSRPDAFFIREIWIQDGQLTVDYNYSRDKQAIPEGYALWIVFLKNGKVFHQVQTPFSPDAVSTSASITTSGLKGSFFLCMGVGRGCMPPSFQSNLFQVYFP